VLFELGHAVEKRQLFDRRTDLPETEVRSKDPSAVNNADDKVGLQADLCDPRPTRPRARSRARAVPLAA
jgi:hypothetical protein